MHKYTNVARFSNSVALKFTSAVWLLASLNFKFSVLYKYLQILTGESNDI